MKQGKAMKNIQKRFINDAMEDPEPLTEWEYDFIQSIADKEGSFELSEKQNHILNRISQKYI